MKFHHFIFSLLEDVNMTKLINLFLFLTIIGVTLARPADYFHDDDEYILNGMNSKLNELGEALDITGTGNTIRKFCSKILNKLFYVRLYNLLELSQKIYPLSVHLLI